MDLDPQTVKQTAPGLLGAIGAMFLMKGGWSLRGATGFTGCALSYFGAEWVGQKVGMNIGLAGFLLGFLGMSFMKKVISTVEDFPLLETIKDWLPKKGAK
jgi:hypothetical protein